MTDAIQWSPQQLAAQEKFAAWRVAWRQGRAPQLFKLAGYAGTGKTTLARYLGGRTAAYMTYIAKAAIVLRQKGCPGAKNIDQWLYRPRHGSSRRRELLGDEFMATSEEVPRPDRCAYRQSEELERIVAPTEELLRADMLVVDEGSMVPNAMVEHLLELDKPLLALYDPAQLPPIGNDRGDLTAGEPDVFLTEIHRQALDNPIIQLSMLARRGERLEDRAYGQSCVVPVAALEGVITSGADQILCGTNRTRQAINEAVRTRDGRRDWYPEPGERLVCLTNWHRRGLCNGSVWVVRAVAFGRSRYTRDPLIRLELAAEDDGAVRRIEVPVANFHAFFDYAYALTVHKAQGSQWDNVLLIDESRVLRWACGIDPKRWLYTGVTRAANALAVVKRLQR
jgi:exodeoxyribonuclease-5